MIPLRRKLELYLLLAVPGLLTLFFVIVCLIPKRVAGLGEFMPLLPLLPVFFWGLARAREMSYALVFAAGLLQDAVAGLPMGMTALLYLFFLLLLHAQKRQISKEAFVHKWFYFAALLMVAEGMGWMLMAAFNLRFHSPAAPFMQWLMTVLLYPAAHGLFDLLQRRINGRRWEILHGR